MVAELKQLTVEELVDLVTRLQAQVRELIAENEALRRGAFTRWDEPVPGETDEERQQRIMRDPRVVVRRRPAGPVAPYEPKIRLSGEVDVLKLLGRRDDDEPESAADQE
jgi:hypothetical protein